MIVHDYCRYRADNYTDTYNFHFGTIFKYVIRKRSSFGSVKRNRSFVFDTGTVTSTMSASISYSGMDDFSDVS